MANKKIRDIVVKVSEYQDHNTGEMKGRYENVGALFQSDSDSSLFIMLKRTFNPAGVPNPDNRDSVLLSCFVPKDQQSNDGNQANSNIGQRYADQKGGRTDFDDTDVPF